MYPLTSNVPAPYELSAQAPTSPPPALARGGKAKHHKMVIAHFNPRELNVLDHLQGEQERCPKTGLRSYSHLEELLKNPHIVNNVHKHAHAHHHAYGGSALEHLAEGGRHGDTEIALIGPHTHHLFDSLAGHRTMNPHTGHPEYFSLGKALGGIWNSVKGAAPALGTALGTAAGTAFGNPALGGMLGGMGGNLLSKIGGGNPNVNAAAQNIAQGIGTAYNAYRGGQSPTQAFGQGLSQVGSKWGNSALGQGMQGMGQALGQGQGLRNAFQQGARQGFEGLGGQKGMMRSFGNVLANAGGPGGFGGAMRNELGGYMNRALPQFNAPQQQPQFNAPQQQPQNADFDMDPSPSWLQDMNPNA